VPSQEEFAQRMRGLVRESTRLEGAALKRALALLKEAHQDILGRIAASPEGGFSRFQLQDIKRSIERTFDGLARRLGREIAESQGRQFTLGSEQIDRAAGFALGAPPSLGGVSQSLLGIAQDFSADLVSGLTADAKARLNSTLQRAVLGGQDLTEIVKEVGRSVNQGQMAQITARALTIARTEILRMHGAAQQARLEQMKASGVTVLKQWHHIPEPNPRGTHLAAHGSTVEVEAPFLIAPRFGLPEEELLYPRDPAASAANTVNCRCRLLPFFPGVSKEVNAALSRAA